MQKRWFHRPQIHSPAAGTERKVGWLELFYDLIYVATFIQLGNALSANVSLEGFLGFAGLLIPLWLTWTSFTFYSNRFVVDDFVHRALVFTQMFAIGAMAVSVPSVFRGDTMAFALAYAVVRAVLVVQYVRVYAQVKHGREMTASYARAFGVGVVLWIGSAFLPTPWVYLAWAVAGGIDLALPFTRHSRELVGRYPPDVLHMSERYGLLTLIVLGEGFVKVLSNLAAHGASFSNAMMGGTALVVTCSLWWIYFDDVAGSRIKKGALAPFIWVYSHLPLTVAVTAVGVALKKAVAFTPGEPAPDGYRWLLCLTLGLVLLSVAVIDSVTQRKHAELSDKARVNVRLASAGLVVLIAAAGGAMPAWLLVAFIASVCLGQVLFDLSMAPMVAEEEHHDESVHDIFEVARVKMERDEGPKRFDVSDAVRKGTPSELRRDLYFHYIEGSWVRLLVSIAALFFITNVVFAALYLLEDGAIAGAQNDSFADAFFFSVQTISTIGYGVLSPESTYANVLVTIEASLGLLYSALATGLMFAKASRPRSSVLFSDVLTVTERNGQRVLSFRVGNARGNDIVEATMHITVLIDEVSREGEKLRRLHDLKLQRSMTPLFALSWTLIHEITEDSPLWGFTEDNATDLLFVATMTGYDSTYASNTHARHMYYAEHLRWNHRFVDVMSHAEDGRLVIDYDKFHDTKPHQT